MLGRDAKLASGVAVPVFLRPPVSRAVKDFPTLTGSTGWLPITVSLAAKLVSASVRMLLTSALPLLPTASLTAVYSCTQTGTSWQAAAVLALEACDRHDQPEELCHSATALCGWLDKQAACMSG